nr:acetate kinase [Prevotella sp.]
MKILVLNCGSSSIKYKLYNMDDHSVLAQGGAERIGIDNAFVKVTLPNGEKKKIMHDMADHKEGVNFVFSLLTDSKIGAIKSLSEIDAVGHRIVQGGDKFNKSVIVDQSVEDGIEDLCDLAPVHNAGHLKGIRAVDALMPGTPQVCVFDNAFHSTMPDYAYLYAVPYEVYEKYHVRRYGFHGTSHRYVSKRAMEYLHLDPNNSKIVTCHIGNGASCAAILNGKVMDTSMGLTPLAGLMMGSRSGDIDASAVTYIMDKLGKKPQEMADYLNKESGLLGISGVSSDMRDVYSAAEQGNERAKLALKMYTYRIKKYIGSYAAAMGGVDAVVFTAGVGENQAEIRYASTLGLEFLGIKVDKDKNAGIHGDEAVISTPDSKVKVAVIPTDEEIVIAEDTQKLVCGMKK